MDTLKDVMNELASLGDESVVKMFKSHGAHEPLYGVKVSDMKKILKRNKNNHTLALALYDTGNSDAMYLAGLMVNPSLMTIPLLDEWVKRANWYMISEYAVGWVAAESPYGIDVARKWITSKHEMIADAGWAVWSNLFRLKPDEELDKNEIENLLFHVEREIHQAPNRVRYAMNGFVIAMGAHYEPLAEEAFVVAERIGQVSVNMGETACKVPFAPDYIKKTWAAGKRGSKKKTVRC
ncbi:DNA alkylation repair protein [Dyadobacter diqingensis]|uniref:DNA alkylation repair protein n=1 Tax=Dyadobacter diqingensis TaxID=2938121 RepID=UPI0020C18C4E|nr:DNA alkylation repair protein [Dyadobacter diqingensis]